MNQASSAVPTETVSVPLKTIDKFRRASPVVVDGFRPYRSNTSILQEAGLAPVKAIFSLFHASCSRTRTFLAVSSCRLHFNRDRQKRGSCHAVQLQRFFPQPLSSPDTMSAHWRLRNPPAASHTLITSGRFRCSSKIERAIDTHSHCRTPTA